MAFVQLILVNLVVLGSVFSSSQLLDCKSLCTMSDNTKNVTYDEVKAATECPQVFIIDVREPQELKDTGIIPNSINIPLGEVTEVLASLPNDKFEKRFGKSKPKHGDEIIFTCRSGKRATAADEQAVKLGYTCSKIYQGSWMDWEAHQKH